MATEIQDIRQEARDHKEQMGDYNENPERYNHHEGQWREALRRLTQAKKKHFKA